MDDTWIPQTSQEWARWLSGEDQKTTQAYLAKPATLIADYNRELATTRAYEGREILELLQNAADQARLSDEQGKVAIELLPEGLVVANTGAPFSVGGVSSLQTAHLSPKRHSGRRYIGNKGLGFRSVLNWTRSPLILSGALSLVYTRQVAESKLGDLAADSEELASLVAAERRDTDATILPILAFPGYSDINQVEAFVDTLAVGRLLARCTSWRQRGYTTAVGMPFEYPAAYEDAMGQLDALRPEILLFVDALKEVQITRDGHTQVWTFEGDDSAAMVLNDSVPLGIWQLYRRRDLLPHEVLAPDQKEPLSYEVVVAVPELAGSDNLAVSPLFSHFPTSIIMPLPVVCHATLELDESRNHAQPTASNRFVMGQLAELLSEAAAVRAAKYPDGPNAGYRLVRPLDSFPIDLVQGSFPDSLMSAIRGKAIVPTMASKAVVADLARIVVGASDAWLPAEAFPEVARLTDEEEVAFFRRLGVPSLNSDELLLRVAQLPDLSVDRRARLIHGILSKGLGKDVHTSALLIDSSGEPVPDGATVFIAPSLSGTPSVPDWITLRFLHEGLRVELARLLGSQDARDLQGRLATFGLVEYSLANVVRRLVAAANRASIDHEGRSRAIDRDLLVAIAELYRGESTSRERPSFPDRVTLKLPNQAGTTTSVADLYMGKGYGLYGGIIQAMYGWAPELLVATPLQLDVGGEVGEVGAFLRWLGVATWPREVRIPDPRDGFLEFLFERIPYPARFGEYVFASASEVDRRSVRDIRSVDRLAEILGQAPPAVITAWLSHDERAAQWARRDLEHAKLGARQGADINLRAFNEPLPSYIRWRIESAVWLLDINNRQVRPKDCVIGERALESLFPHPGQPDSTTMRTLGLDQSGLVEGWRRSGVLTSLAELDLDDVYARLLEAPDQDANGLSARSLYRWLLDAADSSVGGTGTARGRFLEEGRMWGRHGNTSGYYPVTQLRHADSEGLPDALLHRLYIVDLPHRVGVEKVKRVFGLESVDRVAVEQRVKHFRIAADLDPQFQSAKPFLYLLRSSQTSQAQNLTTLKSLALKVCSELTAEMSYQGTEFEFSLPVWGWLIDGNVLFVRSDPNEEVDTTSDLLADAIGAAIAAVFRIGDGGEYARMFLCKLKDRESLLRRMRGEAADEDMSRIIEAFSLHGHLSLGELPVTGPTNEDDPVQSPETDPQDERAEAEAERDSPNTVSTESTANDPLLVEQLPHHPIGMPTRQGLRVQRTRSSNGEREIVRRITDGDFAERKAVEFEEAGEPPRYALRVGHITGSDAPGCDVLSFGRSEDRDAFRSGANRNIATVARFIEVKGRADEGSAIELRGNERQAAERYREKYYLYRVFETDQGDYLLSVLRDPMGEGRALENAVYVHVDRAEHTERYRLTGGLATRRQ
jgi:hypothetical protein